MGDFVISKTIKVTVSLLRSRSLLETRWRLTYTNKWNARNKKAARWRPSSWLASVRNSDGREQAKKKMASEKGEYIYTCNKARSTVLCDNALNREEDNLVSRSLVDEAFDIRLRQQDIWVGVYQEQRHLGMWNAEMARPQEPIQTPPRLTDLSSTCQRKLFPF